MDVSNKLLSGKIGANRKLPSSAFLNLVSQFPYKEDCPVFSCRFNPDYRYSNIFAYVKESGEVFCGDTRLAEYGNRKNRSGTQTSSLIVRKFEADQNAIFDCQWQPLHHDHLFVASGSGSASLWNVEDRMSIATFKGHALSIRRLSVCPDEPHLFATGGRDGSIFVWDVRLPQKDENGMCPVRIIRNAHASGGRSTGSPKQKRGKAAKGRSHSASMDSASVTAILLQDKQTVISGSSTMSDIRFWDLRKIYSAKPSLPPTPARLLPPPAGPKQGAGFTSFSTEPYTRHTLYASRTDNVVYAYSLTSTTKEPVGRYLGATVASFYVDTAVFPGSPYLLCGSREDGAIIWSLDSERPAFVLDGHLDEVCAVAWNDRFEVLTFADDSWRLWKHDVSAAAEDSIPARACCKSFNVELCQGGALAKSAKRTRPACHRLDENFSPLRRLY